MTLKQLAVLARNPLPTSSAKADEWLWSINEYTRRALDDASFLDHHGMNGVLRPDRYNRFQQDDDRDLKQWAVVKFTVFGRKLVKAPHE